MANPSVILIPVLNNPDLSREAIISACRQQGVERLHVLVIDQGSDVQTRDAVEFLRSRWPLPREVEHLHVWRHAPPLPSLAATWNAGLDFAWAIGAEDALVINNDVRLPLLYYAFLRMRMAQDDLGFLSGVGVTLEQFSPQLAADQWREPFQHHPDFSAFLITRELHALDRFDEAFVPAYCEDCDYHRRQLLRDQGHKIGKINVPFLHHSSGVLKTLDPAARAAKEAQIAAGSRTYYARKWGPLHHETKIIPYDLADYMDVTTDALRFQAEMGKSVRDYVAAVERQHGQAR